MLFAFKYESARNRITSPYVRNESRVLREASWPEALSAAAEILKNAKSPAVLMGGRATLEDAYGYSKFARIALQTNDIDFRARPHSEEEQNFLANSRSTATYKDIDLADQIILKGSFLLRHSHAFAARLILAGLKKRGVLIFFMVMPFSGLGNPVSCPRSQFSVQALD